jgi:spore photoproduct lyase
VQGRISAVEEITAVVRRTEEGRFELYKERTPFHRLDGEDQALIRHRAREHRFTFQELKLVCEAALDLRMWNETPLKKWWEAQERHRPIEGRASKKAFLRDLDSWMHELKRGPKSYPAGGLARPPRPKWTPVTEPLEKKVFGMCPVASTDTVCCNLRTIDSVENCGFACSYCTIQTFYGERIVFDSRLGEKLAALELSPQRLYHIGTGQSSDSLMWGNRFGMLDTLSQFAAERPNALLELKTKSGNVAYLLEHRPPRNVFPSWSLNTPTIIANEEHFTAGLEERLRAARRVCDRGVKVGFHFHPLVLYENWRRDYREVARRLTAEFDAGDVLFVSFGSVTFIKPAVRAIRRRGAATKMLQMELVPGPKGKLSYPDSIKKDMFAHLYEAFEPWHSNVFMYLCMEKAELWEWTFGRVYKTNEEFEQDLCRRVLEKIEGLDFPGVH